LYFQKIVVENIFMDNKYIFAPYEEIFDANIFCAEGEKKSILVWYPIQVYELYF